MGSGLWPVLWGKKMRPKERMESHLKKLPEVKNFIYGDFESKYDRTVFKKIPGKAPEAIFFTQSGKEVERLNIEKFDRDELNKMMVAKGIPLKRGGHDEV